LRQHPREAARPAAVSQVTELAAKRHKIGIQLGTRNPELGTKTLFLSLLRLFAAFTNSRYPGAAPGVSGRWSAPASPWRSVGPANRSAKIPAHRGGRRAASRVRWTRRWSRDRGPVPQ